MKVTLKDVALLAGVSRSAVSRSFTAGASVSERTRLKVMRAAEQLGYQPNALASGLTTGRTKLIGLISNNFRNPIFLEVFDLFTRGLQDRGLRPLIVNLSDETDPAQSLRLLRQYSVDGVLVASSTVAPGFARDFRDAGMPVVHTFGRCSAVPPVHVVGVDNVECGRMAARTLIARGYRRLVFLGGPENATSTEDRLRGFREIAVAAEGVTVRHSFAPAYSFDAGRAAMQLWIARGGAEAYFCGDDVLSIGAISALRDAGLSVPQDAGVIGLNDMEMARWNSIDLTTLRQPLAQIIDASIELVVSMLDAPDRPPRSLRFSARLIERGTLRPPDPHP